MGRRIVAEGEQLCYDDLTARLDNIPIGALIAKPFTEGDFEPVARSVFDVPTAGIPVDLRNYPGYDHMQALDDTTVDTNLYLRKLFR
ncbi:hypothetical protein ACIP5Y_23400 [Nocardia sp. NPDC088792]|uniref:hypothetical protein n=1 Tax=Nocardia sp. NPDC088792 TaxID=3364332 RepID=UPI00380F93B7